MSWCDSEGMCWQLLYSFLILSYLYKICFESILEKSVQLVTVQAYGKNKISSLGTSFFWWEEWNSPKWDSWLGNPLSQLRQIFCAVVPKKGFDTDVWFFWYRAFGTLKTFQFSFGTNNCIVTLLTHMQAHKHTQINTHSNTSTIHLYWIIELWVIASLLRNLLLYSADLLQCYCINCIYDLPCCRTVLAWLLYWVLL